MAADRKEEIKQRNDIVDVISDYVALKRSGNRFLGLCPFHQEKTPSFTVSREKQLFHCFGCGAGGDVFEFVMRHDGLDFVQAAQKLAERVGMQFTPAGGGGRRSEREQIHKLNALATRIFRRNLLGAAEAEVARTYLERRGIDGETAERFQLGYALNSWEALVARLRREGVKLEDARKAGLVRRQREGGGYYDWFRGRLMFPISDVSGNVVGFGGRTLTDEPAKYVNTPDTLAFSKGDLLYALHLAAREISARGQAILVEGYMDVIALHQFGFPNVVATMGTAVTPRAARTLARYTKSLVAAFDSDSAGMTAVMRGATVFQEQELRVRIVELPEGKDPDDWVREAGPDAFREAVNSAVTLVDYRLNRALQALPPESRRVTAELVRQVVPILRDLRSDIEREEQIKQLATRWCHPDLGRVQQAEAAIRQELRRTAPTARRSHRPAADSAEPEVPPGQPVPGYVKAERELLSACLHSAAAARYVKERLPLEMFSDETNRGAARALFTAGAALAQVDLNRVLNATEDREVKALLSRLALAPPAMPDDASHLDRQIERIRDHVRRERWETLRQTIVELLAAGELSRDDPRFQEYERLKRHFKGGV